MAILHMLTAVNLLRAITKVKCEDLRAEADLIEAHTTLMDIHTLQVCLPLQIILTPTITVTVENMANILLLIFQGNHKEGLFIKDPLVLKVLQTEQVIGAHTKNTSTVRFHPSTLSTITITPAAHEFLQKEVLKYIHRCIILLVHTAVDILLLVTPGCAPRIPIERNRMILERRCILNTATLLMDTHTTVSEGPTRPDHRATSVQRSNLQMTPQKQRSDDILQVLCVNQNPKTKMNRQPPIEPFALVKNLAVLSFIVNVLQLKSHVR